MRQKNKENVFKGLIAVLVLSLGVLGFYTFSFQEEKKQNLLLLEEEKTRLNQELSQIQTAYDSLKTDNLQLKESVKREKNRIANLIDSLSAIEADYSRLKKIQQQTDFIKIENQRLLAYVEKLKQENKELKTTIDSTQRVLQNVRHLKDSLNFKNRELLVKIEEAGKIYIGEITALPSAIEANGDIKTIKNARKMNGIKVCFTVQKNDIAQAGERVFFIQVINPENNIIGSRENFETTENTLTYSSQAQIDYSNLAVEVCSLIEVKKENANKGLYTINVFLDTQLMATTAFNL